MRKQEKRLAAVHTKISSPTEIGSFANTKRGYWASSEEPGAQVRVREYRDLIWALFEEITHILEDYKKRRQERGI